MVIRPEIFKAYDIRGIYPSDLNEELARAVGRAFVVWLKEESRKSASPLTIVVGRDGRVSSPSLSTALTEGLTQQGANVIDIGIVSSEQFYFACAYFDTPGVTVTASHNPKEYNGMKFVERIPFFLSGDHGINDIRDLVQAGEWPVCVTPGSVRVEDIRPLYAQKLLSIVQPDSIRPLTIVADTANGVAGPALEDLANALPITLHHLFAEVDGTFPNHPADPLRAENRKDIEVAVRQYGAAAGFAFDGDGDRCFVMDETGAVVPNDFLGTLFAQEFLNNNPGATFLYDVRLSWAFARSVERLGGRALTSRVGHAFVKPMMMKEGAVYGVEVSGHHYFRDFFFCDSGLLPMLLTLQLLSQTRQSLSELVKPLRDRYFLSGEMNYTVHDAPAIMARIEKHFSNASQISHIDGVSIDYPDWHCNVRSSNTEPLLRLNLESIVSKSHMEEKKKEVESLIKQDK